MKAIFKAIESNNLQDLKNVLAESVNEIDNYGYSPLLYSSYKNFVEGAFLLVKAGANLSIKDRNGQTILHYVALNNQYELAELLLANGADLSIEDIYGNQPLWTAVFNDKGRNSRIEIIKLFLDYNADMHHLNKASKSPKDIVKIAGYANLHHLFGM
jgi:uncharacterized protein